MKVELKGVKPKEQKCPSSTKLQQSTSSSIDDDNDKACLTSMIDEKKRKELLIHNERKDVISTRFEMKVGLNDAKPKEKKCPSSTKLQQSTSSSIDDDNDKACLTSMIDEKKGKELLIHNERKGVMSTRFEMKVELKGVKPKEQKCPSSTKLQQSTLSRVDSHTTAKPKGKSRGRPVRPNLSVKDLRIMELLAPYKVLHFGRPLTTLLPGDIRRRAIIAAATMLLIPLTDFNLPEDISGLSDKEKETAKLALELFKMGRQNHESGVVEPLPPNVALLTGLRGLLLEITRVDLSSMDIDIGDPDMDAELLRMFKSFFGGWCQPFLQSFNSNGYGQHGKAHTNSKSGDPVVADYGNSAAATVFITHADKPHVRRIGSSSGDAGDEEDDIAGDRPYTEGSPTELTPRRSTRTTTPAKCMSSSKDGGRNWSDADKQNLISILENSGFNSDFSHLASQLDNRSMESVRYLVDYLLSNRVKIEWELDLDSKIDQLLDIYPSSFLTENLHLILKLKSLYGRVPDPSQVGGIKYAECYLFLSSLMGGHVPQGISKMTKHKLFSVFFRFMKETIAGPKHTKCIFEKKNVSHFEINNVLCDRRKRMWTAEEARAREVIESGNMDQIRIFYCSHSVLNPM